eukprot:gnl/MRDRNA2_/MRDRNA2_65245_c0_seq1.p1 gnl/MRDRNA2_/MRDRNA2_65245_c0~~gnl/MRDRNA2_/MRDRNA2_65245_c0_seq1.p1  ORF type:complete len:402 (-),score=54.94 gnl/MRDRNA2_/MRDRNA2_65245_c0_seq1:161-1366(-)
MWNVSVDEQELLNKLVPSFESSGLPSLEVYSMYESLLSLPSLEHMTSQDALLSPRVGGTSGAALWKLQVLEPLLEREAARSLPVLGEPTHVTSQVVREMYDASPYIRWQNLAHQGHGYRSNLTIYLLYQAAVESLPENPNQVLVLGCGTGSFTTAFAYAHPDANITAVDFSSSSLGFAERKRQELGLSNVRYAKADILEVDLPSGYFDFIQCSGVLHHMADPSAGLAVITRLLKPFGVVYISLYSRLARRTLNRVQRWIKEDAPGRPYDPRRPQDLRRFRTDMLSMHNNSNFTDMRNWVIEIADFWSLSNLRDFIFHPMEHQYSPDEIGSLLAKHGLRFHSFVSQRSSRFEQDQTFAFHEWSQRYGTDPNFDANLTHWTDFEKSNPDIFLEMMHFYAQKIP